MAKQTTEHYKLAYRCRNNGDGSVSVLFCKTIEAAEAEEKRVIEEDDEDGWGESSVSSVEIKRVGTELFFKIYEEVDGKYQYVWYPIPEAPHNS